jgi:CheY-like chemotaxis protein
MPRILYVEDNDDNVFMLTRRLTKRGYEILVAADGESGIDVAVAEQPDLILMDLGLPGIDGWETTRSLKADAATRPIPVIALSAHAMEADRDAALAAGCDDFDTKPVDLDRLLGKIQACLDRVAEPEIAPVVTTHAGDQVAEVEDGPTLLVVDDSEDNRYTLIRRLRRQGHGRILEAENGRLALDVLRAEPVDLVLLDMMMPEMNGYEVLTEMREDMELRELPVIMISALDDLDNVIRCLELGAEDYLPKPFDPTVLNARVTASLEKRRLRKEQAAYVELVERERERADRLLSAMVPIGAVAELKARDTVTPRRFDNVAVLFCDIVGFTSFCDQTSPEEVVSGLDAQVVEFERIADHHGMEKIKTIGDAFMATAGMLVGCENPVDTAVACGLDMVGAARSIEPHWDVRVGIHLGPVVAGITGKQRFQFDLWGDTVNVAARICDRAAPGSVVVSAPCWPSIRTLYRGRSLGPVELKGKGPLELVECRPLTDD